MRKLHGSKNKELDSKIEYCVACGEALNKVITLLGRETRVRIICTCRKNEIEQEALVSQQLNKQIRIDRIIKNSLMDDIFRQKTFETWDRSRGNEQVYRIAKKYAENFNRMKHDNVGLLLYGNPGNGKTFAAVAIANEIIKQSVPVVCVSINALLDRIKESYSKWGQEGEDTILRNLANADLVIIDDLGTEQKTEWSISRIYNIIDSRYRKNLPLIITTNIKMDMLKERYGDRTHDRIIEMCTPIYNEKATLRVERQQKKSKLLRSLVEV